MRILLIIYFSLPLVLYGQRSKRQEIKGTQINISTTINYAPQILSFNWPIEGLYTNDNFDLTFLTPTSGIFEVESDTIYIKGNNVVSIPSSKINLGFGYQIIKPNQVYHEFQIPIFIFNSILNQVDYTIINQTSFNVKEIKETKKSNSFKIGFRYELAKYFGNYHKRNFNLGFGINIATIYTRNSKIDERILDEEADFLPKTEGNIFDVNLGFTGNLLIKFNKITSIEFKYLPHMRVLNLGGNIFNNPNISLEDQSGKRTTNLASYNYQLCLAVKFKIKDFNYGRNRKRK